MAYREVGMIEIEVVLRLWLAGGVYLCLGRRVDWAVEALPSGPKQDKNDLNWGPRNLSDLWPRAPRSYIVPRPNAGVI